MNDRKPHLADNGCAAACLECWRGLMAKYGVLCVAYTVMPEHTHALFHGVSDSADCLPAEYEWKQSTSSAINELRGTVGVDMWQKQPYDRVLRTTERRRDPLAQTIRYIWNNPVRRGLVGTMHDHPYTGSCLETPAPIDSEEWWRTLWKTTVALR
ncbi:hypothetical protein GX586_08600 [bacterium]|nr:hypothetical protein [bacterium]